MSTQGALARSSSATTRRRFSDRDAKLVVLTNDAGVGLEDRRGRCSWPPRDDRGHAHLRQGSCNGSFPWKRIRAEAHGRYALAGGGTIGVGVAPDRGAVRPGTATTSLRNDIDALAIDGAARSSLADVKALEPAARSRAADPVGWDVRGAPAGLITARRRHGPRRPQGALVGGAGVLALAALLVRFVVPRPEPPPVVAARLRRPLAGRRPCLRRSRDRGNHRISRAGQGRTVVTVEVPPNANVLAEAGP